MFIDIIPLQKNTARLIRVYGDAPCAALPASVPGPEGGVLAITELGDYCSPRSPEACPGPMRSAAMKSARTAPAPLCRPLAAT